MSLDELTTQQRNALWDSGVNALSHFLLHDGRRDYTTTTGNKLSSDGTWNYTYDAEGNMTKKVRISNGLTWKYGYDHWNHLTHVQRETTDGGTIELSADYKYDAFGNRIEKSVDNDGAGAGSATVTRFAYDQWNPASPAPIGTENATIWGDFSSGGALNTRYLYGDEIDEILARIDGSTPRWYLTDHQRSIRTVVDNSGVIKDSIGYSAFGEIIAETNSAERGRYAWTGREIEVELGMQYNRARYYDPVTARWITQDPLGFDAGDSNLYRYVNNRHTMATDPSGMELLASAASAHALANWLAGKDGDLTSTWGRVPTPIDVKYAQASSGRFVFTYHPDEKSRIQQARDEATNLASAGKNAGPNRFLADALNALLSLSVHREVWWRDVSPNKGEFGSWNLMIAQFRELAMSEKITSNRIWEGPNRPYTLGDLFSQQVGRLSGRLFGIAANQLTLSLPDQGRFLLGIGEGLVMDGLVGDIKTIVNIGLTIDRYTNPFGAGATMFSDWLNGRDPLQTYADDFESAIGAVHAAIKVGSHAVKKSWAVANASMQAIEAILKDDQKAFERILREQGKEVINMAEVVIGGALDLGESAADWLSTPRNRGRVVGAILYEVVQNAVVDFFTAGAGSPIIIASAGRLAKLVGMNADNVERIVRRMFNAMNIALDHGDEAAAAARPTHQARRRRPPTTPGTPEPPVTPRPPDAPTSPRPPDGPTPPTTPTTPPTTPTTNPLDGPWPLHVIGQRLFQKRDFPSLGEWEGNHTPPI